jgi:hypothetical protein
MVHSRGPGTRWPQVEWALEMGARLADPGRGADWLAHSFPRLSPHARLHIRYRGPPGRTIRGRPRGGTSR